MSSTIDVIQNGYSFEQLDRLDDSFKNNIKHTGKLHIQKASCSCCLVRSSGYIILFDTMGPWEKDILIESLAALKVHPNDVDIVVGSHGHPDHIGNLNLFPNTKRQFVGISSYFKDLYYKDCFNEIHSLEDVSKTDTVLDYVPSEVPFSYKPNFEISPNLTLISTPGHTSDDVSLIINNCDNYGSVALAGDLFERAQDIDDEKIWLEAGSTHPNSQKFHRKQIYSLVDWILPGHGPLFRTENL